MEMNKPEVAAVQAVEASRKDAVTELSELDLALVGGGLGDISLG
jgi:hypothetical protein